MTMSRRLLQAALLGAAAAAAVACSSSTPAAPAGPPPTVTVKLTIDAGGADKVSFTDPGAPGGVRTTDLGQVGSFKTSVPKGTTVAVTLSGLAGYVVTTCSITDETDQLVYVRGRDTCSFVAT